MALMDAVAEGHATCGFAIIGDCGSPVGIFRILGGAMRQTTH